MILGFIGVCGLVQVAFYALAAYGEWSRLKRGAVCATLIVLHGAVFPDFFIPETQPGGTCGMPALSIYMIFLIFGIGSAVIIHFLTGLLLHPRRFD